MQSPVPESSRPSPAEFFRGHQPAPDETSSRVTAAFLTAGLYALLVFMAGHRSAGMAPDRPAESEIVTRMMPDPPRKKPALEPPPHFLARLIRPRAAPPDFAIASAAPPAPAMLSPSAAQSSPLDGAPSGDSGTAEQQGAANGTSGNDTQASGCWDAAWAQKVTDRVGRFFYYPARELHNHVTGVVLVHMVIRRYGRVELVKIGRTSGDKALDLAATSMVRNAQPLPWIPAHMHADRIEAELPIEFGMIDPTLKATIGDCGT